MGDSEEEGPTAFILINAEINKEKEVLNYLKSLKGVDEVDLVYGIYDIIAKVVADDIDELNLIVNGKVSKNNHIRSTMTMIAIGNHPDA
ncbi:MAG: Lrp/AsnC ligand binding domain-containing protein [Patescibacteria group bacterium]|nr:Lrp/AsnC ligand binding domain-containing protein [Patescibacteria group bacterium]